MYCFIEIQFKLRCHFLVPEWASSILLGLCSTPSKDPPYFGFGFAHIGQMPQYHVFLLRLFFFQFEFYLIYFTKHSMYSSFYSID